MFKHQILEFLSAVEKMPEVKQIGELPAIMVLKKMLQCSTEIYGGELSSFYVQTQRDNGVKFKREDFLMPYDITLASYSDNAHLELEHGCEKSTRRAMLVCNSGDGLQMFSFYYFDNKKRWGFTPVGVHIKDNGTQDLLYFFDFDFVEKARKEFSEELTATKTIFDVLSCKNVSLTPVDPPEKLNKKRIKNGKQPLYRYHVLTVDLDKGRKQSGVGRGANLGTMPVHLCRGHFKEYTTEKPLFGRVTGRFWWQPYARGKAENGVVMKDYEIKKSNV